MLRVNLVSVLVLLPLSAALASGETLSLSDGQTLEIPSVTGLDCTQLSEKLSEIDGTGYRGSSPKPRNATDLPLLTYEEDVATAYYQNCVIRVLGAETSSEAFTEGYRGDN